jgi:hypothetical protein
MMASGARAVDIGNDYTPAMVRALGLAPLLGAAMLVSGCLESTLVMRVRPDGSGHATLTTRLHLSGLRAFDALVADGQPPQRPPQLEEELPAPSEAALDRGFGAPVRLVSTRIDLAPDGGIRTTEIEFSDVRRLQVTFPPIFVLPAGNGFHASFPLMDEALVTFAMRPHEDGDALLLVKLPNPRMGSEPNAPTTTLATGSPEERLFKQVIKDMSLRMYVETEQPLLRTNAPRQEGNRATIVDLNLDRMVNAMDEERVKRMLVPGSFQELLWQLGDLPGAIVPADTEIFLEYDPPSRQAPGPAAAPQSAPPDTEIYLAPLTRTNGVLSIGAAANISNSPGYDNQPSFTADGRSILFSSVRGPSSASRSALRQTDIYRYDLASRAIARVTQTADGEFSPTPMLDGTRLSAVTVEADGTQRLYGITPRGGAAERAVILPDVKPVGYHAWADDHTLALFVLGEGDAPATLQIADTRTGATRVVATGIGRSVLRMPGEGSRRHISFVQRESTGGATRLLVKDLDPVSGDSVTLTPAVEGSQEADLAWTPDGTLLMVRDDVLFAWRREQPSWTAVAALAPLGLHGVTRLAVSPTGDSIAFVAAQQSR